jgi:serine phosphatase RsbU (regulator of sigma subunit)
MPKQEKYIVQSAIIVPDSSQGAERLLRLECLQDVCRIVSSTLDLDQTLPLIARMLHERLGFERAAISTIDTRAGRLVGPVAIAPTAEDVTAELPSLELRAGAGPVADVALGRKPYYLRNEAFGDPPDMPGVATGMAPPFAMLPLRGRGQVVGVLQVANPATGRRISDDVIEHLRPFAEQIGMAIEQAGFLQESRRRVAFLSTFLQISTSLTSYSDLTDLLQEACDRLLEVAGLDLTAVFLAESEGQILRLHTRAGLRPETPEFHEPFRVGERLAGRAARERLVIVYRNLQNDVSPAAALSRRIGLRTVVCAPLVLRGQLLGVLAAGSLQDLVLTGEETDLVASVANQLSAAIANVRLLEETRRRMEEHRRGREELTVLYGISRAMVATIGLEERLRVIAEGLTEATRTTRCAIFRLHQDGVLPWISYGDTPEEKRRFQSLNIAPADATRLLRQVSARKPPVVMLSPDQEPFSQVPWLSEWGVRSALWLPLAFQSRLTGLAMVYQPGEERHFHDDQVELAAAVANQAATAIRISQAYEHERDLAETLQRSFMPSVPTRLPNFDLGQTYHPALKEADVGGDFYDLFSLPDGRVAMLMADVSGKGLPAALQTAMVKYMLRAYAVEDPEPAVVLDRLNRGLCAFIDTDLFVSAFYGVLSPANGELRYANAGHDSPILVLKADQYCTSLDVTGPVLALEPTVTYFTRTLQLSPGDLLLLYTDGIVNARRRVPAPEGWVDELYGRDRLETLLAELAPAKPDRIVSQIYRTVRAFAEGNLHDDCALLALKAREVWKHPAQP